MAKKATLQVDGIEITVLQDAEGLDMISLTDIARKQSDEPRFVIRNWMSTQNTITYLGEWESLHNPDFNRAGFRTFRNEFFEKPFSLTPSRWLELTNSVGIRSTVGKSGGTFAHRDIAINFCYWISPIFQIYLIKEFQRLKEEESERLGLGWNLRRELSKANYAIHADAVRQNLVPLMDWNTRQEGTYFASEADLLNLAVFGTTAREWKSANPDRVGNIRDAASELELQVLANMESLNAGLIQMGFSASERLEILAQRAGREREVLASSKASDKVKKLK